MINKEQIRNINDLNIKYIIRNDEQKDYTGLVQTSDGKVYGLHFVRVNPDITLEIKQDDIAEDLRYYIYISSTKEIDLKGFYAYKSIFDTTKNSKFLTKDDFYMEEIIFGLTFEQYKNKRGIKQC